MVRTVDAILEERRYKAARGGRAMTPREEAARAQSLGVSLEEYRAMTPEERRAGASAIGASVYGVGGVTDFLVPDDWGYGGGGGYRPLTFAQTEAGVRLAASLALETERFAGQKRIELEEVLHGLAQELLPPEDVETAMGQVRRGEVVKSKLAFQAVLQNLADEAAHAERRADLDMQEENERRTLREARARITVETIGRDVGRAVLFALGAKG
jgi:hypothetical protein